MNKFVNLRIRIFKYALINKNFSIKIDNLSLFCIKSIIFETVKQFIKYDGTSFIRSSGEEVQEQVKTYRNPMIS